MKDFETADSAEKVYNLIIENAPTDTSIFFDVDDTFLTPKSKTFRKAPYNQMIDRIKENKNNYDNYEEIVSNWRFQRKVILIDEEWAEVINKLKAKFPVYALTQMNTGEFGNILSMQDWRYKELKSLGIEFSDNEELAACSSGQKDDAICYKGIFITGNHSKSGTLSKFSDELNTSFIVFVDDREKHVEDVRDYCKKNKIGFLGILFDGLKHLMGEPDPKLAAFQESYLIENAKWLEDEEAYELMAESNY
ncbi:hypothetical protein RFEPED_0321 [Rickettsia felis str. Pedreira]|uniref:HAD super, subIIIB family protein n=2 Tax=Rickettsia felis TaxID=42862 RepID=A0A0F3MQC5_RICFI|nr:DUF2608 domain-containing protein [Rickettsia felis]AAY61374.1 unknown [Rickettsia felis URRWXCal2]KHO02862.1 hypothetical protein JS55_03100 [Rickettsia felis str. LSU]KHO03811.1 hypothetical protein JS61_02945 [Rickettsia felis]KJV57950.1 hypothetical protein RFEPED_0321 [Rickettsia felis str. Pedreira]MDE8611072.1 DUF2608 domain-containing protein [Rickettsia felis]